MPSAAQPYRASVTISSIRGSRSFGLVCPVDRMVSPEGSNVSGMSTHDIINDQAARELLAHIELSRIPGECIAAAKTELPPIATDIGTVTVDTVAPYGIGPIRLFFEVHRPAAQLRRRGVNPFWVCVRAQRR